MSETHRNSFVLDRETGHPGYDSTVIYATPRDLEALGRELASSAASGPVSVSHYATWKEGQSSRVYLEFRTAAEGDLDRWHRIDAKTRLTRGFNLALTLVVLALAAVGLWSLFH
ncbi:MAG: hypothetical protein IPK67_21220 [Planctomycetes bacterium]|nr:hypothetical protein [Planctomycetota bacterium]